MAEFITVVLVHITVVHWVCSVGCCDEVEELAMTKRLTPETDYEPFRCGEKNINAKLGESMVRFVRRLLAAGMTQQAIAKAAGVSQNAISMIKTGKSWSWLK